MKIPRLFAPLLFAALLSQASLAQSNGWMTDPPKTTETTEAAPKVETEPQGDGSPKAATKPASVNDPTKAEAATEEPTSKEPDADATGSATSSADATLELARKAQNPISSMISLPFQYNANFGVGPNNDTTQVMNIQPVVPVPLSKDMTLVNRAIIPISYVPNSAVPATLASGAELGLGEQKVNLSFQAFANVVKPTNAPDWSIRCQFTLLFS